MDAPRNVFLAGARLSADKHRCRSRGNLAHEFAHFAHFSCVADEFARDTFDDVADFLAFYFVERFYRFEILF